MSKIVAMGVGILSFLFIVVSVIIYWDDTETETSENNEQVITEIDNLKNKLNELENRKPEVIYKTITNTAPKEKTVADIIAEWKNRVAEVECVWIDNDDEIITEEGGGSATLVNIEGHGLTAVTNKHVVFDSTSTYAPNSCSVGVYGKGVRIVDYISPGNPVMTGVDDVGLIFLGDFDQATDNGFFDDVVASHLNFCKETQINLGDQVVILGYPTIGTKKGITATEGIISGIEDDYYVTSAKIDHGNSGGAAILVKDNCWIGIPTWAASGSIESLGRILKAQLVLSDE